MPTAPAWQPCRCSRSIQSAEVEFIVSRSWSADLDGPSRIGLMPVRRPVLWTSRLRRRAVWLAAGDTIRTGWSKNKKSMAPLEIQTICLLSIRRRWPCCSCWRWPDPIYWALSSSMSRHPLRRSRERGNYKSQDRIYNKALTYNGGEVYSPRVVEPTSNQDNSTGCTVRLWYQSVSEFLVLE